MITNELQIKDLVSKLRRLCSDQERGLNAAMESIAAIKRKLNVIEKRSLNEK